MSPARLHLRAGSAAAIIRRAWKLLKSNLRTHFFCTLAVCVVSVFSALPLSDKRRRRRRRIYIKNSNNVALLSAKHTTTTSDEASSKRELNETISVWIIKKMCSTLCLSRRFRVSSILFSVHFSSLFSNIALLGMHNFSLANMNAAAYAVVLYTLWSVQFWLFCSIFFSLSLTLFSRCSERTRSS